MLLIYTFDKNSSFLETFQNEEMRINFGFKPKKNTRVKLRMISFSNQNEGSQIFLNFPDLIPGEIEEEIGDFTYVWEIPGLAFQGAYGGAVKNINAAAHYGRWTNNSDTLPLDIDLGRIDHTKDYFTVVVNARRATDAHLSRMELGNIQVVIEMNEESVIS